MVAMGYGSITKITLHVCMLPHKVKMQYVHSRSHPSYFLLPWKIPEEIADNQYSSITKGSIFHTKHKSLQPFTMGVD